VALLANIGVSRKLRAGVVLCGVQHASVEQGKPGAAIHCPLEHFQPVYLTLSRAGDPGKIKSSLDGANIAPQTGGKCFERCTCGGVEHLNQGFLVLSELAQASIT